MLPNDEKSPAAGMPPPLEPSKSSMGGLQNPLHDLYNQSMLKDGAQDPGHQQAPGLNSAPTATAQLDHLAQPSALPTAPAPASDRADAAETSEEVWVEKTKAAIEQTQNDPHRRAQALQQLRATYQSERFRKGGVTGS